MTKLELVATRWYRAPEGLLSSGNYTTAGSSLLMMLEPFIVLIRAHLSSVDVWSVGCILAELLGRKVLFPGRTDEEQIELIINTFGTPSAEELDQLQDDMVSILLAPSSSSFVRGI